MTAVYARLRQLLRDEQPVALVTVIDGPGVGRKLLITPDGTVQAEDLIQIDYAGRCQEQPVTALVPAAHAALGLKRRGVE